MSAPVDPSPSWLSVSRRIYMSLRDLIARLIAGGSTIARIRNDGGNAAFLYEAMLRLTFGTSRAEDLVRSPKSEVRKLAPVLFGEAFEDVPAGTKTESLALSIFGTTGIILMVAVIIGAGICINIQRIQSGIPPSSAPPPQSAANPADAPGLSPAPPSKGVTIPGLNPLPNLRFDSLNQAAPTAEPGGKTSKEPAKPQSNTSPPPDAQQQRKDEPLRPKQAN